MHPTKDRFRHQVDLRIPGFFRAVPPGAVKQYDLLAGRDAGLWYARFQKRITSALKRGGHVPVLRVSDGEFSFCVGYRPPYPPQGRSVLWHYFRSYIGALRVGRFPGRFRSGAPKYGWEEYWMPEWYSLRKRFGEYVREIAGDGILAINFSITNPPFAEHYVAPFCDWLDREGIPLTEENYYPFYFVYALLNGSDANEIYRDRHVLICTSLTPGKKTALAREFEALEAASTQFIGISRNRSMADQLDLSSVRKPVDLALVGAGVGTANVIHQLRPLETLCLDAGFAIECILDPGKRQSRVFCIADSEL